MPFSLSTINLLLPVLPQFPGSPQFFHYCSAILPQETSYKYILLQIRDFLYTFSVAVGRIGECRGRFSLAVGGIGECRRRFFTRFGRDWGIPPPVFHSQWVGLGNSAAGFRPQWVGLGIQRHKNEKVYKKRHVLGYDSELLIPCAQFWAHMSRLL